MTYEALKTAFQPHGLICRGGFRLLSGDPMAEGLLQEAGTVILIGNAGSDIWPAFQASPEALAGNGIADPLDRWTRRIVDGVAVEYGARAFYPFDGPPYHPFQQWAMRADRVFASPTGPLIHPEYGLWHAYRAALVFEAEIDLPERRQQASPCDACSEKPCLSACPVVAFRPGFYDVAACVDHLDTSPSPACFAQGCLARHACPVGQDFAYSSPLAHFHMRHFVRSQRAG